MSILEGTAIAVLALWTLASVACCFRGLREHAAMRWNRRVRACSSWRLFSSGNSEVQPGVLGLDYRDRSLAGAAAAWNPAPDSSWAWHAFLWLPERRLTSRVYYLIRELHAEFERSGPGEWARSAPARLLAHYLTRRQPVPPGHVREFRLVVRQRSGRESVDTIGTFVAGPDGHLR